MVSSRKRGRQEMEAAESPKEPTLLQRIRNMWEFANLAQWLFIFGRAVKVDEDLDIEDLEMECMKTQSTILPNIGLALLKFVSSHRGLTPELFDEYTRRQYVAKAPLRNPFGDHEDPAKFTDFDVFTKIRVLQQLTQWTMGNPDRIRERMEEHKDSEQTIWRIEPFGWDSEDRTYFVLDDNRLYRRTDPPPTPLPLMKPKKNSKKAKAALRASKRRKISMPAESEDEMTGEAEANGGIVEKEYEGLGGMIWECIAITLDEFNAAIASMEKSRDPNEKVLRNRITRDVLPLLEKQEEARKRKAAQKERELLNLEKLATAKRSSRIAGKVEQQKYVEEAREVERKKQAELAMAQKEQEKWMKLEKERESRMQTREQRLKEREARRILHEEELANLSEDNKKLESGESRVSERHLKAEIEKKKQALENLAEEEDWIFDCICGAYGQIDDGTHSIACDKCNIWQHSKCVGVSEADADRDDFHFICTTCQRRAKDEERAKNQPPIKIKINRPGSSSSPFAPRPNGSPLATPKMAVNENPNWQSNPYHGIYGPHSSESHYTYQNMLPHAKNSMQSHDAPPTQSPGLQGPQQKPTLVASGSSREERSYTSIYASNGTPAPQQSFPRPSSSHAFSSPHPHSPTNLPPPVQSQVYTFVNGNTQFGRSSPAVQSLLQTPTSSSAPGFSQGPSSPSIPYGDTTANPMMNGGSRVLSDSASPLVTAPVASSSGRPNPVSTLPTSSSPMASSTPALQTRHKTKPEVAGSPQLDTAVQDPSQASALPPAVTGLSPTKHSPPRPTPIGSASVATPTMLPPIRSLSPNPQLTNLTPPVKQLEPEWNRVNGHLVGP